MRTLRCLAVACCWFVWGKWVGGWVDIDVRAACGMGDRQERDQQETRETRGQDASHITTHTPTLTCSSSFIMLAASAWTFSFSSSAASRSTLLFSSSSSPSPTTAVRCSILLLLER